MHDYGNAPAFDGLSSRGPHLLVDHPDIGQPISDVASMTCPFLTWDVPNRAHVNLPIQLSRQNPT